MAELNKNIIYIEDRAEDIALVKRVVKREFSNVSLISFNDSEKVLKEIEEHSFNNHLPSLLLIDINMPRVSGFDILAAFEKNEIYKKIPKVIFSSSTEQSDITQAYSLNCNSYLEKPSTYIELKEKLSTTINYWLNHNIN